MLQILIDVLKITDCINILIIFLINLIKYFFFFLQSNEDIGFEDDPAFYKNVLDDFKPPDKPPSGLLGLVQGSFNRVKRSLFSFFENDKTTETSTKTTQPASPNEIILR